MIPPVPPPDEPARLSSLRELGVLDTPAEERFDRVTRIAQALFDVPIALVSLVDADRQWFKSHPGLDAAETSREISFCGHAIRGAEVFVVPDALRDERFSDNPLVVGAPEIRFYAGAPLSAPDGHKIGTLCLIDRKPREMSAGQRAALRDLADLVQGEIARTAERASLRKPLLRRLPSVRKLLAVFAAALALLAGFSTAWYRAGRELIADTRLVVRTQQELDGLDRLISAAPGASAVAPAGAIAELRRLAAADPLRRARLENMLRPRAAVGPARGLPDVRAALVWMRAEERQLLAEYAAHSAAEADRLSRLLIISGFVRTLVVLLALYALFRELTVHEKFEDELKRTRDEALSAAEGRRVAQAESEKSGERLRAVLDHIDIGVIMVELDGRMSVFNVAAERIHGAWRDEFERLALSGTHPPMQEDERTAIAPGEDPLGRALKGQTVRDARLFYRTPFRPNGYRLSVSAVPLRSHQGLLAGAVLMFSELPAPGRRAA